MEKESEVRGTAFLVNFIAECCKMERIDQTTKIHGRVYEVYINHIGALYTLRDDGQFRRLSEYQIKNMKPIEVVADPNAMEY
jgi:hypothetical protein